MIKHDLCHTPKVEAGRTTLVYVEEVIDKTGVVGPRVAPVAARDRVNNLLLANTKDVVANQRVSTRPGNVKCVQPIVHAYVTTNDRIKVAYTLGLVKFAVVAKST